MEGEGEERVREGEGGEGRRVECGRSKGGGRETTQRGFGGVVGQLEGEGVCRAVDSGRVFEMKWGQRVRPRWVSNM